MRTQKLLLLLMLTALLITHATIRYTPVIIKQQASAKCSYEEMKQKVTILCKQLNSKAPILNYDLMEKQFVSAVVDSIMPYWYGTAWHFNGTTQRPGTGAIACGYFVSTILRDVGLKVNRAKMGQAASQTIIRNFAEARTIKTFYDKPLDSMLSCVKLSGMGLYIVGLDYHVGFLYNDGKLIWFIHSKWASPKAVVKEAAPLSGVLYYSKYRMIGKISSNKKLLKEWIGN